MRAFSTTLVFGIAALIAHAHPETHVQLSREEQLKRDAATLERLTVARGCGAEIEMYNAQRRELRAMKERGEDVSRGLSSLPEVNRRYKPVYSKPYYSELQNTTCVLAPEVTEGPYYINDESVRKDVREDQAGVTLVLDIGIIDIRTCKPLANAYVDIWAANATGYYSGFTAVNAKRADKTDNLTWLRGGQATDKAGIAELYTVYPGFYTGRTIHVHAAVLTDYQVNQNKTLDSGAGHLRHMGQIFFEESWNTQVLSTYPYNTNTQEHTLNDQDYFINGANSKGYNAYAELKALGRNITQDGLLAYITIGVDTQADLEFKSTAYNSQ